MSHPCTKACGREGKRFFRGKVPVPPPGLGVFFFTLDPLNVILCDECCASTGVNDGFEVTEEEFMIREVLET